MGAIKCNHRHCCQSVNMIKLMLDWGVTNHYFIPNVCTVKYLCIGHPWDLKKDIVQKVVVCCRCLLSILENWGSDWPL